MPASAAPLPPALPPAPPAPPLVPPVFAATFVPFDSPPQPTAATNRRKSGNRGKCGALIVNSYHPCATSVPTAQAASCGEREHGQQPDTDPEDRAGGHRIPP